MRRSLLVALALIAACRFNQSGSFRSRLGGDVSRPAKRVPFDAELLAACARDGAPVRPGALRRTPYLQQVTSGSALLLWTQASTARAVVEVTTPTGDAVATVTGTREKAERSRGALQLQARLRDLAPRQIYCYQLSIGGTPVTDRTGFRTAPAAGSGAPVRIAAWGDSGWVGPDQDAIVDGIESVPFDLMIHMGDIAYPRGTLAQFEATFFQPYARLLRHAPMFAVSGNHEYGTRDAWPYRQVFALPENGAPGGVERWFSFDWGDVHFVALDTEKIGSEQASWLQRDLAANELPWVIVYLHRPPFSSGDHGSDGAVRRWFVPIFEAHDVPLVLAGHDHHYERSRPQNGVHYIVSGGGGRGTRPVDRASFTAYAEAVLNFLFIEIEGDVLTVHAIDGAGREFDSLRIERGEAGAEPDKPAPPLPAEPTKPEPESPQHEMPPAAP
jgi:acid phosphatase type 7